MRPTALPAAMLLSLSCALPPTLGCEEPEPDPVGPDPATLEGDVEVLVDGTGVSHIYASTEDDLYFVQGYRTAHDRLFEMDLLRRRARGTRAEVLGEEFYESDLQSRAMRLVDYAEETIRQLERDDPEMYLAMSAYAAGVDRYIADAAAGRNGARLSPQFAALGYEPDPWTAVDCAAIDKLLTAGLSMRPDQDITLGLVKIMLGDELFEDFYIYQPFDREYIVPEFYDGMGTYPPTGTPPAPAPPAESLALLEGLDDQTLLGALRGAQGLRFSGGGSNAFAVSGALTDSGAAILASDSHQGIAHPAVYYLVHLSTAEDGGAMDVVGANFPGVPFVMFGHNQRIAWGPTTSILDVADAYLEKFVDEDEVEFLGERVEVDERDEVIRVRAPGGAVADAEERTVTLQAVPHHGPLLPPEALGLPVPLAISIRWTGYQPRSGARTFYEIDRAADWDDFQAALRTNLAAGQHFVYADVDGHVGYSCRTDVPLRERVDPDVSPVTLLPGEGGYEWLRSSSDPLSYEVLPDEWVPHGFDPERGFFTTANNDPVGQTDDNDPYDDPTYLSALFDIGTRALRPRVRIEEIVAERPITADDMAAIQLDDVSRLGERLVPYVLEAAAHRPDLVTPEIQQALDLLAAWDLGTGTDQVAPSIFHAWLAIFVRQMLQDEVGVLGDLLFGELSAELGLVVVKFATYWLDRTADDIEAIEAGQLPFPSESGVNFFDDRYTPELETRDELILASLGMALDELAPVFSALGADPEDPATWRWGLYHTIELRDYAGDALPEASSARLEKPGALYTVDVGDHVWLYDSALPATLDVRNAPSNRFVTELRPGDIRGRWILPGGQSESPDSPHHNDQLEEYVAGEYRPMLFYRGEVEADTAETWRFPAGFPGQGEVTVE